MILWTRVTPRGGRSGAVRWEVSASLDFATLVASGELITTPARDYTVKVDASALPRTTLLPLPAAAPPRGPHPHRPAGHDAAPRRGLLLQPRPRVLPPLPRARRAPRPRRRGAPRRLHLRVPLQLLRQRAALRPAHGDRLALRLPPPPRLVQARRRPARGAPAAPDDRHLGRPRVRQQRLGRRRTGPHARHRGRLARPQGRRDPGLLRVDAHPRAARRAHLAPLRLRRPRRPGDARHPHLGATQAGSR
ncbi:MAG: PhoD-like phosphatase N-terminal domain-containing protein [Deltaproteobacteria bacterium]|nr:PhoD-like phosphatase N-terminal domain-containing protein [Deltaproteobacteria bacterium]